MVVDSASAMQFLRTAFEPDDWKPGYPNPAFSRMKEQDAAWMARIIAEFSDEHLREAPTDGHTARLALDAGRLASGQHDLAWHAAQPEQLPGRELGAPGQEQRRRGRGGPGAGVPRVM